MKNLIIYLVIPSILLFSCQQQGTRKQENSNKESQIDRSIPGNFAIGKNSFDSKIGNILFNNGYPDDATSELLYNEMDFQRAVQVYLWSLPLVSMRAAHEGNRQAGASDQSPAIWENLLFPNTLVFTGNNSTLYTINTIYLDKNDPLIIEIPGENVLGMINNAWQQPLEDLGIPGPDKGKGGKYLILPPDYKGEVPTNYFAIQSDTYLVYYLLRAFESGQKGVDKLKQVRVYRLSQKDSPPEMKPFKANENDINLTYPVEKGYFEMLSRAIFGENARIVDKNMSGIMAELGLHYDKPFKPNERMKEIFNNAEKVGNAMASNISFNSRNPKKKVWNDRQYSYVFLDNTPSFENDKLQLLDSRINFAHQAFSTGKSMTLELVGAGSKYFAAYQDEQGNWLDGSNSYTLHIEEGIPARNFWAVTVYDAGTRSMIATEQNRPELGSKFNLNLNSDKSIDIIFGPTRPNDPKVNWIQTIPNKGFFIYFRLYGPEQAWYDGSWKLNDIEKIK